MDTTRSWLARHITLHDHADAAAERENAASHLLGVAGSLIFALVVLIGKDRYDTTATFAGMLVYASTLLLLYASSTLYHHLSRSDAKRFFRLLDHANIYVLIAGTYTPILLSIGTGASSLLTALVWFVALGGILFSVIFWGRLKVLHVTLYLAMGWMIVFFWDAVVPNIPAALTGYIIAAGITYSIGVIFYALKSVRHSHMVWHLFCVAASAIFCIGFLRHL
jgi:hemolysin III